MSTNPLRPGVVAAAGRGANIIGFQNIPLDGFRGVLFVMVIEIVRGDVVMEKQQIFGIDPGPTQSAYVLWDGEKIIQHGIVDNGEMLCYLDFDDDPDPPVLAIEMVASFGMPVGKEVFETCVWIGRFSHSCLAFLITRHEIKMHFCDHIKGVNDAVIRQALIDRLGKPGTKKHPGRTYGIKKDEWQALAVAVCALDRLNARSANG